MIKLQFSSKLYFDLLQCALKFISFAVCLCWFCIHAVCSMSEHFSCWRNACDCNLTTQSSTYKLQNSATSIWTWWEQHLGLNLWLVIWYSHAVYGLFQLDNRWWMPH